MGRNTEYVCAAFFIFTLFKDKAEKVRRSRGFCRVIGQLNLFAFPNACPAVSRAAQSKVWHLVSGKGVKSALRNLKPDWLRVHLCGFHGVIRVFLFSEASFVPLFPVQFAPPATRICHLHFAPQAFSKANELVVWLFGCSILCAWNVWCAVLCGVLQPGVFSSLRVAQPVFACGELEQLSTSCTAGVRMW